MAVAWTGDVDGVGEVFLLELDAEGAPLGDAIMVSPDDGARSYAPAVESSGEGWAVAWMDARHVDVDTYYEPYVRVAGPGGLGAETRLSDGYTCTYDVCAVDLERHSDGVGAAWHDAHEVYYAAVADDGSRATGVTQLTNDPFITEPLELAWGGDAYSAVWSDVRGPTIYYGRVTREGVKEVLPVALATPGTNVHSPSLCWDGEAYAVIWIDDTDVGPNAMLARVATSGALLAGPIEVAASRDPSIARVACTGLDYGVTLLDHDVLYALTVSEDLDSTTPEVALTDGTLAVVAFAAVWRGRGYAVATIERPLEDPDPSPPLPWDPPLSLSIRSVSCEP
jgi:hypothetical protein